MFFPGMDSQIIGTFSYESTLVTLFRGENVIHLFSVDGLLFYPYIWWKWRKCYHSRDDDNDVDDDDDDDDDVDDDDH